MSVTNFIDDEKVTIVQGVNGILLCRESWMTGKKEGWDSENSEGISISETEEMEKDIHNDNQ